MRTDTAELGQARRQVEQLLTELPRPSEGDQVAAFNEPWELRAFALAVAAHEQGLFEWSEFQQTLIAAIRRWEEDPERPPWQYYERWMEALESLLSRSGVLSGTELEGRTAEVIANPPSKDHHKACLDPVAVDPACT